MYISVYICVCIYIKAFWLLIAITLCDAGCLRSVSVPGLTEADECAKFDRAEQCKSEEMGLHREKNEL